MKTTVHYAIVHSKTIGDSFDEATYEICPQKEGGFYVSAVPTRGGKLGSTTLIGQVNELRFRSLESAKQWLESQPGFGKPDWFTREVNRSGV